MPNVPPRNAAFIVVVCLLVIFAFTTGFLISSRSNSSPDMQPSSSTGPVVVAPVPATLPEPATETLPVPDWSPGPGRPAIRVTDANGKPFRPASLYLFDATIYDVRMTPDQISRVNAEALTKAAATTEEFEKALAALGIARPLYRAHLSANFNEEQWLKIANDSPVTGPAAPPPPPVGRGGNPLTREPGAVFDMILRPNDAGILSLVIAVKASLQLQATAPTGLAAPSPLIRSVEFQTDRAVALNQPFLLINADATALDSNGKAIALITHVVITAPLIPAATAPATASKPAAAK